MSPVSSGNRLYTEVPEIVNGYEIFKDCFSIVMPAYGKNFITNPSVEFDMTGFDPLGTTMAFSRDTSKQKRGAYSLKCTPAAVGDAIIYSQAIPSIDSCVFSFDLWAPVGALFSVFFNGISDVRYVKGYGFWHRESILMPFADSGFYAGLQVLQTGPFWLDGLMVEEGTIPTTYIDGDQQGFTPYPDYFWLGAPHASPSIRSASCRAGGIEMNLSKTGFMIMSLIGLSMLPVNNVATQLSSGGAYYQNTIAQVRDFSLVGSFTNPGGLPNLMSDRQAMISYIQPDVSVNRQPLLLKYTPHDSLSGDAIDEALEIPANYKAGLEGTYDNEYQERSAIQFTQFLPAVYTEGQSGAALPDQVVDPYAGGNYPSPVIRRDARTGEVKAGVGYSDATHPTTVTRMKRSPYDGLVYEAVVNSALYGSQVKSVDNYSGPGGTNGTIYDFEITAAGVVYMGGTFTIGNSIVAHNIVQYNYKTHTSFDMGGGVTKASGTPSVTRLLAAKNGMLYMAGAFDTAGGATAHTIARYNMVSTNTYALASDFLFPRPAESVNVMIEDMDGRILIGGTNSLFGSGQALGYYDPANDTVTPAGLTFSNSLDIHNNFDVTGLALTGDGSLYVSGDFTSVNGVTVDGVFKWNRGGGVYALTASGDTLSVSGSPKIQPWGGNSILINGATLGSLAPFDSNNVMRTFDPLVIWDGQGFSTLPFSVNQMFVLAQAMDVAQDLSGNVYAAFASGRSTLPQVMSEGYATVTVNSETSPWIRFRGPGQLWSIDNVSNGERMVFSDLILQNGEVATLKLDGNMPDFSSNIRGSLAGYLSSSSSMSFVLSPGDNLLGYWMHGDTYTYYPDYPGLYSAQLFGLEMVSGLSLLNTDRGTVYVSIPYVGSTYTVNLYKDSLRTQKIAHTVALTTMGYYALIADNASGVGGYVGFFPGMGVPDENGMEIGFQRVGISNDVIYRKYQQGIDQSR